MNVLQREILIITDNPTTLYVVTSDLESRGHLVLCTENDADALHILQSWRPDFILMDMNMPFANDWGFFKAFRDFPFPQIPVIVCAATTAVRDQALAAGAKAVIEQPIDLDTLLQIIEAPRGGARQIPCEPSGDRSPP